MPKKIWLLAASGWTLLVLVLCLVSFSTFPGVGVKGADKYVHVIFHFVFTILWFLYIQSSGYVISNGKAVLRVVSLSIVFGILIEMAQELLTATRGADLYDVIANISGALLAATVLIGYARLKK